jgi:hypothetical protein
LSYDVKEVVRRPCRTVSSSTLKKLYEAGKQASSNKKKEKSRGDIQAWLETLDSYTLHRPVRKRFPRNPYTVTNIGEVWEADIMDLSSLKIYNDNYKYILQVIDVFSKYLHSVPLLSKTGAAVTSAFKTIL